MKTRNIHHNIYALLKEKPKEEKGFYVLIGLFIVFGLFLAFYPMESSIVQMGVYDCNKEKCFITSNIRYATVKEFAQQQEIKIKKEKIPLKILSFGSIEFQNNEAYQTIMIEIPKQDFYPKQTIEYRILKNEKNFLQILRDSLKGGEEK